MKFSYTFLCFSPSSFNFMSSINIYYLLYYYSNTIIRFCLRLENCTDYHIYERLNFLKKPNMYMVIKLIIIDLELQIYSELFSKKNNLSLVLSLL